MGEKIPIDLCGRSGRSAPFGAIGLPSIDPAEVAAVALSEDGHAGRVYTLTGPALSTRREQAAAIDARCGWWN